jgi:hypothetical protein
MSQEANEPEPQVATPAQLAAAVRLLADDQSAIAASARACLLRAGAAAMAPLRAGAESMDVAVRARSRSLLRAIETRDSLARFSRLRFGATGRSAAAPVLEGAVLLAKMVRTFVPDASDLVAILRYHATELQGKCAGRSLPVCARLLAEQLHDVYGLRGAPADATSLDHVSIDRVLTERVGAPVTLSLVYLLVARFAGLSASGVAIPGHFLVRLHGVRPAIVDPYHGGRTVTKADCARYLRGAGHHPVLPHLRDLGDHELLLCHLRALREAAQLRPAEHALQSLGRAEALLETP